VLTQTIPPDLAAAICESEALAVVALLLLLAGAVEDFAMEFEGAAIELAGAGEAAGGAEGGAEVAAAGAEPESVADFLLLRARLACAAAESGVAVAAEAGAAGSVAAVSAFLLFFDPPAAVELSELAVAASAEASFFFLRDFFDPVSLAVAAVSVLAAAASVEAAFLLFFDFDFLAVVSEVSVAADWSDALASVFAFFFFFLVVVVEVWSSVELAAWGLARALIPDITKNMQSTIIHVLSLVCSLVMISSSRSGLALNNCRSAPQGVWGASRPVCGATIMTFRPMGVNLGKVVAGEITFGRSHRKWTSQAAERTSGLP
jgi:hypothetical protein